MRWNSSQGLAHGRFSVKQLLCFSYIVESGQRKDKPALLLALPPNTSHLNRESAVGALTALSTSPTSSIQSSHHSYSEGASLFPLYR